MTTISYAKQLLQFEQTKHPILHLAEPQDFIFARAVLPPTDQEIPSLDNPIYPVEWVDGKASFRSFLRSWRKKFSEPQERSTTNLEEVTPPKAPLQQVGAPRRRERALVTAARPAEPLLPTPLRPPRLGPLHFTSRRRSNSEPRTPHIRQAPRVPFAPSKNSTLNARKAPVKQDPVLNFRSEGSVSVPSPEHSELEKSFNELRIDFTPQPHTSVRPKYWSPSQTSESESSVEIPRATTRSQSRAMSGAGSAGQAGPSNTQEQHNPNDGLTIGTVAQIVAQALQQTMQQNNQNAGGASNIHAPGTSSLTVEQVGFFNPKYPDPDFSGMVPSGKQCIFTDVYAFTDRLKELATTRGEQQVKTIWSSCLQNTARAWLTTELTPMEKDALLMGSVDYVCDKLIIRFRKQPSLAMQDLRSRSFSLMDLKRGKEIRPFINSMVRDAKSCGWPVKNQLEMAFEALDYRIQRQLKRPDDHTSVGQFLDMIDDREQILRTEARETHWDNQQSGGKQQFPPSFRHQNWQNRAANQQLQHYQNQTRPWSRNPTQNRPPYQNTYQSQQQGQHQPSFQTQTQYGNQNWQRNGQQWQNRNQQQPFSQNRGTFQGNQSNRYNQSGGRPQTYGQNSQRYQGTQQRQNAQQFQQNRRPPYQTRAYMANQGHAQFHHDQYEENDTFEEYHYEDQRDDENQQGFHAEEYPDDEYEDQIMSCGEIPEDFGPPMTSNDADDAANFGATIPTPRPSVCGICHQSTKGRNDLFRHIRDFHTEKTTRSQNRPRKAPSSYRKTQDVGDQANIAVGCDVALTELHHADERMAIPTMLNDEGMEMTGPLQRDPNLFLPPLKTKSDVNIVQSRVDSAMDIGTGFAYKSRTYLKFFIMPSPEREHQEDICADTGCTRTLADRTWIQEHYPKAEIRRRATPMIIRGIAAEQHLTSEYTIIRFYFKGVQDGRPTVATFVREVTLVQGLQAHMLMGTDILDAEQVDIIMSKGIAIIQSCRVAIPMSVTPDNRQHAKSRVTTTKENVIPPQMYQYVEVSHAAHFGQDLIFEPKNDQISCFASLATDATSEIIVRNDTNRDVKLPKNTLMGHFIPMEQGLRGHQVTDDRAIELAIRKPFMNPRSTHVLGTSTEFVLAHTENSEKHPTGTTIYKDPMFPDAFQKLADVVSNFEDIFQDRGYTNVPYEELPRLNFKSTWEHYIPKKCRPYIVNEEDQKIIDATIDKLVEQKRMFRNRRPVPFSMPVFVIYKEVPDHVSATRKKGRMVVDTRVLNSMTLNDAYPMKSQEAMLATIQGKPYITILDATAFYYQWRVHPSTRWALTITTTRGQYTFNCLVMGYKGSNAYVQRQMDIILEPIPAAECYCDDICISSSTIEEHAQDLSQVFMALRMKNISIGPSKSFIGFPNAVVLGRLVDSFGLSTTKERLAAISKLVFPTTLRDLEIFIGLAGYMRTNVPRYAQLVEPLEKRKTDLLRRNKRTGRKNNRKRWAKSIPMDTPTERERLAFEAIKNALTQHSVLCFFSPTRILCIDFDVSRNGIGVCVYHVKEGKLNDLTRDGKLKTFPPRAAMDPIAFLSRTLSSAEKNYWPTEMEVLGLVWALRKTQHFTAVAQQGVYVFTDHKAILGLNRHKDLVNSTALSNKNLRLVRALEYITKFDITMMHKPGKDHIVPDALSRLPTNVNAEEADAPGELDKLPDEKEEQWLQLENHAWALFEEALPVLRLAALDTNHTNATYPSSKGVALIQIDPALSQKMKQGYTEDPKWKVILNVVQANMKLGAHNAADLQYHLHNGLLWKRSDTQDRLCVPRNCYPAIFQAIHGESHMGPERVQTQLMSFVIDRKEFAKYLKSCPECAIMRKRTHKPYGNMQPIASPPCPFHTITLDIAMGLPRDGEFNAFGVAIDKFSKMVQIIPGATNWSARQWAAAYYDRFLLSNWGMPKVIISDRDPKFLSEFWKHMWTRYGTNLLYSTAYHPQTDGQSERYILFIKSALRYFMHSLEDKTQWRRCLPRLQFEINSTRSSTTKATPMEAVYGFTPNIIMQRIGAETRPLPKSRIEIHDAITTSAISSKKYYDSKHQPMYFKENDKVLLRLHKGYNVPEAAKLGPKLGQQFAGPFRVMERIGRLAYRLEFPKEWRIHDVVSVDHLEPAPPLDVFGRYLPEPNIVIEEEKC